MNAKKQAEKSDVAKLSGNFYISLYGIYFCHLQFFDKFPLLYFYSSKDDKVIIFVFSSLEVHVLLILRIILSLLNSL